MHPIYFVKLKYLLSNPINASKKILFPALRNSDIDITDLEEKIGKIQIIFEAGAADGVDTNKFLKLFPNSKIFCLEPVIDQYNLLKKKFIKNSRVRLKNLALSDSNGSTEINIGSTGKAIDGMGSSSISQPKLHKKYFEHIKFEKLQPVKTVTFSKACELFKIKKIDLLWLDLQGLELKVITSSSSYIEKNVKSFHLEISNVKLYEDSPSPNEIKILMNNLGFKLVKKNVGALAGNALYINTRFAK